MYRGVQWGTVGYSMLLWGMEEKGFQVRGASFDLGNKEFLSDIDLKNETHKIENPADQVLLFFGRFPTHVKAFPESHV